MGIAVDDFRLAVRNVARFGDTDVFPYPFENQIFAAREDEVVQILNDIHSSFDESIAGDPPLSVKSFTVVGYHGFRASTQTDRPDMERVLTLARSGNCARHRESKGPH